MAGRGGDVELGAELLGALLHGRQPVVAVHLVSRVLVIEATAIIGDSKGHRAIVEPELDVNALGLRMANGIRDRFLTDAQQLVLHLGRALTGCSADSGRKAYGLARG